MQKRLVDDPRCCARKREFEGLIKDIFRTSDDKQRAYWIKVISAQDQMCAACIALDSEGYDKAHGEWAALSKQD